MSPRRAAAPLAVLAALAVLVTAAPALPELQPPGRAALVAALPPLLLLAALAALLADRVRTTPGVAALVAVGAVLTVLTTALDARGAGTVAEVLLAIGLGLAFARVFDLGAFVLGLPLVLGTIDAATTLTSSVIRTWPQPLPPGDPLVLELPSWSAQTAAGQLSIATVLFLAALQASAVRERLRPWGACAGMAAGLVAAYVLEWATDRAMPATAFVAAGFLLGVADRLPAWWRAGGLERG
ncbi:hypothetical protein [Patulibacter sp. SYSU D01012]|uniref:hypothetical protein n=1 Tax=Patulibacter sp. SYSU D01012 TaxID=2817381 RepID=UPI001B316483|nr:hypothetical protein [Patulibacter sp. SYSU D01012]